jgi:pilus assembly protein Flp/PilA
VRKLIKKLRPIRRRDEGASAVEYGLLIALIAVVIAGAVLTLGQTLRDRFNTVNNCVATSANC